jgi:hypothetical protein
MGSPQRSSFASPFYPADRTRSGRHDEIFCSAKCDFPDFARTEPLDCRSDVRRRAVLPKQTSKRTPVPPNLDRQTLTSRVFGVPSYREIMPALPPGGASKPTQT